MIQGCKKDHRDNWECDINIAHDILLEDVSWGGGMELLDSLQLFSVAAAVLINK